MLSLTAEHLVALRSLQQRVETTIATQPAIAQQLGFIGQYLVDSEAQLMALMTIPQLPPPAGGTIELGMVLYWIHHDLPSILQWMEKYFPPTKITPELYAQWQKRWSTTGVIAPDGTMVADGPFSQLDKGWLYSSVLYILRLSGEFQIASQGQSPTVITLPNKPTLTVALIGDWGTGPWSDCGTQGPATAIMQQLQNLSPAPDVILHLGDVYYSGTGHLPLEVSLAMIALSWETQVAYSPIEEDIRLLQRWWSASPMPQSFTLNSNHEMYSGANGYFNDALASPIFASQRNTSYFALYYQDWALLGLDSALYSSSIFNMQGALQNAATSEQVKWVQSLNLTGKNIIAMTHHTALSADGIAIPADHTVGWAPIPANQLYNDMYAALNNQDPDYWYWGHIHNGVVYNNNVTMSSTRKTKTMCRCVGHSAIPFGAAYYWQGNQQIPVVKSPNVDYCASTPLLPNPSGCKQWNLRVKNGFAVLALAQGSITESFYEQGNTTPVWTSGTKKLPKK